MFSTQSYPKLIQNCFRVRIRQESHALTSITFGANLFTAPLLVMYVLYVVQLHHVTLWPFYITAVPVIKPKVTLSSS